ncbi:hypothetical protein CLV78_103344 [Aliiruegeria haliotis]|uniref:Uncharacterized protein n=1 Tax=Aliiruegeria haliotis TaxID=1280846 RepID=A0A2T0RTI8_9RHOB|nr:hypothetical protein [Aliiruegeria haliotis]PRY24478.1 hypothetical protein CLV78_103344 [Aliiruegeria haliotis]
MSKHVLDHPTRRDSSRVVPFVTVRRRLEPTMTSPRARVMLRRTKAPVNASLRTRAFLRIERGYEA